MNKVIYLVDNGARRRYDNWLDSDCDVVGNDAV